MSYPRILDDLDSVRRQWRFQKLLEGGLLTAALVLAVLVVAVAADNLLRLGGFGRAVLAAALWGTAGAALLSWVIRRWLEDRRDDFFAALVEQKHPELANRLINALQLGRGNDQYGSRRLIDAIVQDAAEATAELEMGDCLDWTTVRRSALAAAGVTAVIVLYAVLPLWSLNQRFGNGLARVLLPWADYKPFSATKIAIKSPQEEETRIPEGASITIEAAATGAVPRSATLFVRDEGSRWRSYHMQPAEMSPGLFRFTVLEPTHSFEYYVSAGDGRSEPFDAARVSKARSKKSSRADAGKVRERYVEVVARPRVESLKITYTPPRYTGEEPRIVTDSDGEIAGVAGTQVDLELTSTKPLQSGPNRPAAVLLTDANDALVLSQGSDSGAWRTSFTINADGARLDPAAVRPVVAPARYQLRLTDTDGYDNGDPLWRSISLAKDQPPVVALTAPGKDLQAQPADSVEIAVAAKDDYGLAEVRLLYRVNDEQKIRELASFAADGARQRDALHQHAWKLESAGLKSGDVIYYWAAAVDRNDITGPGRGESRRYSIFIVEPDKVLAQLENALLGYAEVLEEILRLQRENRAQTASNVAFATLVTRQTVIRLKTRQLTDRMQKDATPIHTVVAALNELHVGLMADCIRVLESGKETADAAKGAGFREQSLPVQDQIIEQLQALLARLQKNEQARERLRKLAKTDQQAHWAITARLNEMTDDLQRMLAEEQELTDKFEKLPKKKVDELSEDQLKALDEFDEFQERWEKWAKGTIDELAKLPTGFVDDFGMREDVNRIFQEIEKAASRPKAEKIEVALEDLGAGLATEMLEDLEVWMPDTADSAKWVLEEPPAGLKVPEMPLPSELEDMVGDLLQEAEEFDEEADDITSAWGDNLNQAGWDVADGPISSFSAKGKTGNDLPNKSEMSGRSGDGRRGKSSGQMVGDTARGLEGRKTEARVNNERYEPGQVKMEGQQDPNGATGGGKKAGAGRRGLQGGTPPDFVRDMERLSEKQAALREKAEQVARELDSAGVKSGRLDRSIQLMKSVEDDLGDKRYDDAARRRKVALSALKSALSDDDQGTAVDLSRARELPSELREELLQSADEGYPAGYESLLKSYFRALSEEK